MKFKCFAIALIMVLTISYFYQKKQHIKHNNTVYGWLFDQIQLDKSISEIVIIPHYICISCNWLIFSYIEEIIRNSERVTFVFLNNKETVFRMISEEYNNSDLLRFFDNNETTCVKYPTILSIKNNSIQKVVYQNIKNPYAFENLVNKYL